MISLVRCEGDKLKEDFHLKIKFEMPYFQLGILSFYIPKNPNFSADLKYLIPEKYLRECIEV